MVKLLSFLLLEVPDSFFCLNVLEVSIHFKVSSCLALLFDCLLEGVVCESAVVCMLMLDPHTAIRAQASNTFFASTVSSNENPHWR